MPPLTTPPLAVPAAQEPPPADVDAGASAGARPDAPDVLLEGDLLVEEISIDGMCGVY